ncbi:hypothetical protein [Micromonospora arida]
MTHRSDDLTPLLIPQPGPGLGFRQGVVTAWNPLTAENTIEVAGATLTNVPILNTNEAVLLSPGAVVGLMTSGPSWFILGRVTVPGTPDAASALRMVSSRLIASSNLAQGTLTAPVASYTDLSGGGAGPSVSATISSSGKALVLFGVEIAWGAPVVQGIGGYASVAVSGATTIAASASWGVGHDCVAVEEAETFTAGKFHVFEGLNPGQHTFTMKYRAYSPGGATPTVTFREREIAVFAL